MKNHLHQAIQMLFFFVTGKLIYCLYPKLFSRNSNFSICRNSKFSAPIQNFLTGIPFFNILFLAFFLIKVF